MSASEANSRDNVPNPLKPMVELDNCIPTTFNAHSKHGTKNFSRINYSNGAHSPLKADRISKHVTFLNTPIDYIIPNAHDQTSKFLTNNPEESSANNTSRFSETNDSLASLEEPLEEDLQNLTIYTSYETTRKLFFKSTIDWNGIAKAHRTPEIETISAFLDCNEHYPLLNPDEKLKFLNDDEPSSEFDTFKSFYEALEKTFPQYDFETIQRAIDIIALEQGRRATNGAPTFIMLYSLLAQIWHAGLTIRDAWLKFQENCFMMSFDNFSILLRQAEIFRAQDTPTMNVLLTEFLCAAAGKDLQMEIESDGEISYQLDEIFFTVLPHIYFSASGWSEALELFNAHFGAQLTLRRFKKFILPVIAQRLRPHDVRHTARIRRVLKKEALRTGLEITPENFCRVFSAMTGFRVEEVVLRDVQNYLLAPWRGV